MTRVAALRCEMARTIANPSEIARYVAASPKNNAEEDEKNRQF
jgi:hypothetical protein